MAPTFTETLAQMGRVFAGMFAALLCAYLSCPAHSESGQTPRWLASRTARPAVHHTERWFLGYGVVWLAFAPTVGFRLQACTRRALPLHVHARAAATVAAIFVPGDDGRSNAAAGPVLAQGNRLDRRVLLHRQLVVHALLLPVLGAHYTMTWDANGILFPCTSRLTFIFAFIVLETSSCVASQRRAGDAAAALLSVLAVLMQPTRLRSWKH